MTMLLDVAELQVSYGAVRALHGIGLQVPEGEIRVVLGANGAGKSSLLRAIIGLVRRQAGSITFSGQALSKAMTPYQISRLGIGWVPEGREVFGTLTVAQNLRIGAFGVSKRSEIAARMEHVFRLFPILGERKGQSAATLSGGEQQMLAIGRALMSRPRLLLIDEPSLGLAPLMVQTVFQYLATARSEGLSLLLAEQNAVEALAVTDWAYVLQNGAIVGSGTAGEIADSDMLSRAFLGAAEDSAPRAVRFTSSARQLIRRSAR